MDWNEILNWKLLKGSHEFPGPDGGTCINEAAIVAAGFKYKSVRNVDDCPPCFSPILSSYAMSLNEMMPDDLRQELLMPFVTRLAGAADTFEIERERWEFIARGLTRLLGDSELWAIGDGPAYGMIHKLLQRWISCWPRDTDVRRAVELLDGAMRIGKQADPIDHEVVVERLARARAAAEG